MFDVFGYDWRILPINSCLMLAWLEELHHRRSFHSHVSVLIDTAPSLPIKGVGYHISLDNDYYEVYGAYVHFFAFDLVIRYCYSFLII